MISDQMKIRWELGDLPTSKPISPPAHRVTRITENRQDTSDDHKDKTDRRQKADLQWNGQDQQQHTKHNHELLLRSAYYPRGGDATQAELRIQPVDSVAAIRVAVGG
jgi:hypothetical protein